jgi:hypothetical protein
MATGHMFAELAGGGPPKGYAERGWRGLRGLETVGLVALGEGVEYATHC